MKIVRVICAANGSVTPHDDRYVVAWNPDTEAGILELTSTADPSRARRFTMEEVHREWSAVSRVQPKRPWDGQPNRPLSGVSIEIEELKDAQDGTT
ncbi:MAG TPA: hypothetical protein VGJ20_20385 [Xanthobacteraceae bacterium]|jgi:hypothetical protein